MKTYVAIFLATLVLLVGACTEQVDQGGSAAQDSATAGEQNKAIMASLYEVFNTGDMTNVEDLMVANVIEHQMMPGVTGEGIEAFRQTVQVLRDAFPDFHITADQMIAEGDFVATRFTMSGTQDGPFMDAPPSGNRFEVSGIDIVRFEQGKGAEHWGYQDDMAFMQQLGMMPEEEQPAP